MAEGEIAERGTHHALLAQEGLYASMWARQSKGFKKDRARLHLNCCTARPATDRVTGDGAGWHHYLCHNPSEEADPGGPSWQTGHSVAENEYDNIPYVVISGRQNHRPGDGFLFCLEQSFVKNMLCLHAVSSVQDMIV